MRLEVLVATMHQKDFSKIREMNIRSDVVFANQADRHAYEEVTFEHGTARMITTPYRGVGLNRNQALLHASGDILLFADDDVVYADDYAERVVQAFEELPNADVLVFEADCEQDGQICGQSRHMTRKLPFMKSWKYGTCRIAVKREAIQSTNIWFHTQFGGGCKYSAGEDSLFLTDCYRKGLRVYSYSYVLGRTKKDTSTWFAGFNEKYYRDKGAWLACVFPRMCRLVVPALTWKWRKQSEALNMFQIGKLMYQGITDFKRDWRG